MSNYEYQPEVITESAAYDLFDDLLDDCYGYVELAGYAYSPSAILKAIDPIAYREEFLRYIDNRREEYYIEGFEE